jgi:hypothetical protein
MFKILGLCLSVSLVLLTASCGTGSSTEKTDNAAPSITYVDMPANTEITVTLVDSIDTDFQLSGSGFRAKLSRPVVVNGYVLFETGAAAKGVLNNVVQSGRLQTPAELSFSLTGIQDRNGHWIDIGTNMIVEKKASHTNREVAMIGGGAIVGGIIGKIVDRKASTEIGAAAGAAAGTGMSALTGKNDIFYGSGSEITFFSSQSTSIALE